MILVTGGAGFIGSNFILDWLAAGSEPVINLDRLTYAGNLENLASVAADARYRFERGVTDARFIDRTSSAVIVRAASSPMLEASHEPCLADGGDDPHERVAP